MMQAQPLSVARTQKIIGATPCSIGCITWRWGQTL